MVAVHGHHVISLEEAAFLMGLPADQLRVPEVYQQAVGVQL
jgi:hypothetical protein